MISRYVIFLLLTSGVVKRESYADEPDIRVNYLRTATKESLASNGIDGFLYFDKTSGIWEKKEARYTTPQARELLAIYAQQFLRERP